MHDAIKQCYDFIAAFYLQFSVTANRLFTVKQVVFIIVIIILSLGPRE